MAEGYLVKRLKETGMDSVMVISSGTAAFPGLKPTLEAAQVMQEYGIDVSSYISSSLSKEHIESADVILTMEPRHKERIIGIDPKAKSKTYLLREFSEEKNRSSDSIIDPIGKPVEFYKEVFESIKNSIEGFLKWIKK